MADESSKTVQTLTLGDDVQPRDHVYLEGKNVSSQSPYKIFTKTFEGFQMRFDHWGRIVIDKCPSDQEHILNPREHDGERSRCRHLLEELIPKEFPGQEGDITIAIQFTKKQNFSMGAMVDPNEPNCGICEEKKP